jgi:hypothetical protein
MQAEWHTFLSRRTEEPAPKRRIIELQSSQRADSPALTGGTCPTLPPGNPPDSSLFASRNPARNSTRKNSSRYRKAALLRRVLASEEEKRSEKEQSDKSAAYASTVAEIRRRPSQRIITPPLDVNPEASQEVKFAEKILR